MKGTSEGEWGSLIGDVGARLLLASYISMTSTYSRLLIPHDLQCSIKLITFDSRFVHAFFCCFHVLRYLFSLGNVGLGLEMGGG